MSINWSDMITLWSGKQPCFSKTNFVRYQKWILKNGIMFVFLQLNSKYKK